MGQLLSYSIQSGILLLAMYLIYKWILANENQYRFNRIVLLSIYAIAFTAFPIINLFAYSEPLPASEINASISIIPIEMQSDHSDLILWKAIVSIYLAGMICVALRTLLVIGKLYTIVRRGEHVKMPGCTLVLTDNNGVSPFSWMHFIVMSREEYESSGNLILAHERQHICCRHWIDLLLAQLVILICWFNPAAWLLREELKAVHEYEADKCVLRQGVNAREYQMLLIKKAVGARFPSLANSLNHSKLKKRITMMNNQTTDAKRRMRVLALAPAIALAVLATDIPCVAQTLSATAATALTSENDSKGTENLQKELQKKEKINVITIKADKDSVSISPNNNAYIYKVDGKIVESISDLKATDIATVIVDKQGVQPVVTIVTKANENPNRSAIIEKYGYIQCKMEEINNIDGTNVKLVLTGIGDNIEDFQSFKILDAKFIDNEKERRFNNINANFDNGEVKVNLHLNETMTSFYPELKVVLNTNIGILIIPYKSMKSS